MAHATLICPKCRKKQLHEVPDRCLAAYRCHHCFRMNVARKHRCIIAEFSDAKCPREHGK